MTRKRVNSANDKGRRQPSKGKLGLIAAASVLLIGASIAQVLAPLPGELRWSNVASADGGSTIPVPPPPRPTPQPRTETTPQTNSQARESTFLDFSAISLSPDTSAQTPEATIPLTGDSIYIETDPSGAQWVILPLALAHGQEVKALQDQETGITWLPASTPGVYGILTIPLARGQVSESISIHLGPLQSNGQEAKSPVLGAELIVGPIEIVVQGLQPGRLRLSAILNQLPPEIILGVKGIAPDAELVSAVNEAAQKLRKEVVAVAYGVKIETNLSDYVASASIALGVDKAWADVWPRDQIYIARVDAQGKGHLLATTFSSEDALGRAWFGAGSVGGLSTFALAALADLAAQKEGIPGSRWLLWLGIGVGMAALIGLAAGGFLLISSQRRNPST